MQTLYHQDLYDPEPVESYWEAIGDRLQESPPLSGDQSFEVAVIGAGYTGLSTALHLARDHQIGACVLDAGPIGWGASSRNGGFGCVPATKMSLRTMISRYGLDETKRFFAAQLDGLELVKALCESEGIECDLVGDGNFEVAHKRSRLDGLRDYAAALTRHFGIPTRCLVPEEFAEVAFQSSEQYGGIHLQAGFGLHPQKFVTGLARAAVRHGVSLYPRSEVLEWNKRGDGHVLATRAGTIRAKRVVMATNGFTREGLYGEFDNRLLPAISNIVTTRPLTDDELAAHRWSTLNPVINSRTLLFYFRLLPDNSFLFGARGDTTGSGEAGEKMKHRMTERLREVFPHWRHVPISHFWRGLVCMTRKKAPSIGRVEGDASVWYAFGYHANGVNTAPWAGKQVAHMIASGDDGSARIPLICRGNTPRFPLPRLRVWYLRLAYQYYRLTDAL